MKKISILMLSAVIIGTSFTSPGKNVNAATLTATKCKSSISTSSLSIGFTTNSVYHDNCYQGEPLISYGNQGPYVKKLQGFLNLHNYPCGREDGVFGTQTQNAVKNFQHQWGLPEDGVVGMHTWGVIDYIILNDDRT